MDVAMNINKKFRVGDVVALEFDGEHEIFEGPVDFGGSQIDMGLNQPIVVQHVFMEDYKGHRQQRFVPVGEPYYMPNSFRFKLITPAKEFNKKDWM